MGQSTYYHIFLKMDKFFCCIASSLLRTCGRSLVAVSRGLLFPLVRGLLIAVTSLAVEQGL